MIVHELEDLNDGGEGIIAVKLKISVDMRELEENLKRSIEKLEVDMILQSAE